MGNSTPKLLYGVPRVVVIGGGYAGTAIAKALDETGQYSVVVIDRKNYFLHNIGALRAATDPDYSSLALIPYSHLLRHGAVVQAEVTEIHPNYIRVHGRETPITFDFLIIATGSSYSFPGKIAEPKRENALKKYHHIIKTIEEANNIVVVGGGPVGVELVGEIREFYPKKSLTLIHSYDRLLSEPLKDALRDRVYNELITSLNIDVWLNNKVLLTGDQSEYVFANDQYFIDNSTPIAFRTLRTSQNKTITADLILFATGTKSNKSSLLPHFQSLLTDDGRLIVDDYLRVQGYSNIFAIGDIANAGSKMAWMAQQQALLTAENIKNITKNQPLKKYQIPAPAMIVTMGKKKGAGQLPNANATIIGNTLAPMLKGKDLFAGKTWASMNANPLKNNLIKEDQLVWKNNNNNNNNNNNHNDEEKKSNNNSNNKNPAEQTNMKGVKEDILLIRAKNLGSAMGLTEQNAKTLLTNGLPLPVHAPGTDAH